MRQVVQGVCYEMLQTLGETRLTMATVPTHDDVFFLGIDGGGSKCRASIYNNRDELLGTGIGGPANPFHGVQRTLDSIVAATELALTDAGLPVEMKSRLIAGVGLAGVNLPSLFSVINNWKHPFSQMYLTTDLHIACLGAHKQNEGAVLVAGTGSCGYSWVNGQATILGAHGFPFGDQCSGAWMGLEAIKAVLLASDGLGPDTIIREWMEETLQAKGVMIVDKMANAKSSDYAKFAILVLNGADQQDAVALRILQEGAAYMSDMAKMLWQTGVTRMSFIGGLSHRLVPWLDTSVASRLSEPLAQPEYGAVFYARQQSGL